MCVCVCVCVRVVSCLFVVVVIVEIFFPEEKLNLRFKMSDRTDSPECSPSEVISGAIMKKYVTDVQISVKCRNRLLP